VDTRDKALDMLRRAMSGEEKLWAIWWIGGLCCELVYVGLYMIEDGLRPFSNLGGDVVSVFKLLVFATWASAAWRCSRNVERRGLTLAARAALVLLVGATGATL